MIYSIIYIGEKTMNNTIIINNKCFLATKKKCLALIHDTN